MANSAITDLDTHAVPCRDVEFMPVRIRKETADDGTIYLRCEETLCDFDANFIRVILNRAAAEGDKTMYAQRTIEADGNRGDWRHQSFAEARSDIESIGQWFHDQGLSTGDSLLIVSGNSIAHAMMRFGAMAAGVASCPVSVNYSLMGGGYERLKYVVDMVKPKVIFAESGGPFDPALAALDLTDRIVVTRIPEALSMPSVSYDDVCRVAATDAIRDRIEKADPDAPAAYMLTSGSTGMPKAVIQTMRMLSTNLHQGYQAIGRASGWDDVMVDWLPWNHVSGCSHLYAAAVFGGTLYIDGGKPAPGLFDETIRNLKEISVPYFCNVPAGFAMLVDALEADEALRRTFFKKLRLLLYGGAALPQAVYDRLQTLAVDTVGRRITLTSGYGATETTSGCMAIYFETEKVGVGLPCPGVEVKLVPQGDRYDCRLRGDNVMRGYLDDPEKTAQAFDEENFYKTGDAVRFHDEDDVAQGLYFAGRLAEEFKLGTGTWVYGGQVRARLIEALAPAITDLILCGVGRDSLAVLGVPSLAGLKDIAAAPNLSLSELVGHADVRNFVGKALAAYNAANKSSSTAVTRFAFLKEPPNPAKHEVSDKGTINQLIASENRADEIDALYAEPPADHVMIQ